jgi:3',5'-cyclic AMP phosphodiesterase CpdA
VNGMPTIAHLSDLHFGRIDPRLIEPLIQTLTTVTPDVVAISGDLTQRARRAQFLEARRFLDRLPFPLLVVPGNHDVPLYNLAARLFRPYDGYQRYIQQDLEPVYEAEGMLMVGLNSARRRPFSVGGRLNEAQVARAAARLQSAADGAVRIVVTHHPFDVPDTHGDQHLIGRADMTMRRLAVAGVDLFLAGHLHVSHVGETAARYRIAGHSALVVQAGTMSTRRRGEVNAINVLRVARTRIEIARHSWSDARRSFEVSWSGTFDRASDGFTSGRE